MILFQNPGTIDLDAALIMGVNAKVGTNPIGFFGSGLKYAIAVLLRTGHQVVICKGVEPFHFTAESFITRGQTFQRVCCNGQSLGFTTDLGKKWEVWQAFRELHCNATDEGGTSDYLAVNDLESIVLLPGTTSVIVIGPMIEEAWHARGDFLYMTQPDITIDGMAQITKLPSKHIFYRGIRIKTVELPYPFTVNFTQHIDITEDRTLKYDYQLNEHLSVIGDHLAQIGEIDMVKDLMQPKSANHPVAGIYWGGYFNDKPLSPEWLDIFRGIAKTDMASLTPSARQAFGKRSEGEDLPIQAFPLNDVQRQQLDRAMRFSKAIGFPADEYPIIFASRLGGGVLAMVKNGKIYLSLDIFEAGTKQLATALAEEFIHLRHGHMDESRNMQNFLFNRMLSMAEEHMGEAI